MIENLEQNLNDNVGEQGLEKKLNENLDKKVINSSQSVRENLSKNTKSGVYKNSCENLGEGKQSHENLDKNSSEASSSAKNLNQAFSKCKAQNFFKKHLSFRFKV